MARIATARRVGLLVVAAALVGAAALAAGPKSQPVPAELDLLELPAPTTAQGHRRLMLDIAHAGKRLVAVGEFGVIIYSDDGGRQWQQASVPSSVMLTAVTFVDDAQGWAVGHDGVILASSDGGKHWTRQFDGHGANPQILAAAQARAKALAARTGDDKTLALDREQADDRLADAEAAVQAGPSRPLLGVRFLDPMNGFAVGALGQIFQTRDAGKSWNFIGDRLPNGEGLHLNGIAVTAQGEIFIAAEAGTVFRSADRGQTWARAGVGYNGAMFGVVPVTPMLLVAYGFGGHLFRSADGGATWKAIDSPTRQAIVQGAAIDDARVLLCAQDGQLLASRDGGQGFRTLALRPSLRKLSGFTLDGGGLVAVGLGGTSTLKLAWEGDKP